MEGVAQYEGFFFGTILKRILIFLSEPNPVMQVSNPVLRAHLDTIPSHYYTAAQSEKGAHILPFKVLTPGSE